MEWRSATKVSKDGLENAFEIPQRWLLIHYYEALNVLFRMENALRVFVYVILKKSRGEKWDEVQLETESGSSTIRAAAARRMSQARGYGYLGYEIASPLMFMSSGELTRLIFSAALWDEFRPHFKGKKEIIQNKMDEIGAIRNSLAHFRPIRSDDVEVVKQNVRHAFVGIEQLVSEMIDTNIVVPTNSVQDWYSKITATGSENCKFSLYQDVKSRWVRVVLRFDHQHIGERRFGEDQIFYSFLRLSATAILREFKRISGPCIFCFESINGSTNGPEKGARVGKQISFVFDASTLANRIDEIVTELNAMLGVIEARQNFCRKTNLREESYLT